MSIDDIELPESGAVKAMIEARKAAALAAAPRRSATEILARIRDAIDSPDVEIPVSVDVADDLPLEAFYLVRARCLEFGWDARKVAASVVGFSGRVRYSIEVTYA